MTTSFSKLTLSAGAAGKVLLNNFFVGPKKKNGTLLYAASEELDFRTPNRNRRMNFLYVIRLKKNFDKISGRISN